jgi:putative glycosyltransferase (TIGR04348 family)
VGDGIIGGMKPQLVLVTPAGADANNGNWQTASRWARWLSLDYQVRLVSAGQVGLGDGKGDAVGYGAGGGVGGGDVMLALHARRSAGAMVAWRDASRAAGRHRPLVLALTGTDLYRDIHSDATALRSLALADRLIVLHERAVADVPEPYRGKAFVCEQSCSLLAPWPHKAAGHLRAVMVGHLRDEKDPRTYYAAARLLADRSDILLDHVGAALDPELGAEAHALALALSGYRWLGAVDHARTRKRIQRAHVLVHASRMEGGAHVVMEAMRSGTPVLASRISGNVGLLGEDYGGYFAPGDAPALAALLRRARDDAPWLAALARQAGDRAWRFEPARERATLRRLVGDALASSCVGPGFG